MTILFDGLGRSQAGKRTRKDQSPPQDSHCIVFEGDGIEGFDKIKEGLVEDGRGKTRED